MERKGCKGGQEGGLQPERWTAQPKGDRRLAGQAVGGDDPLLGAKGVEETKGVDAKERQGGGRRQGGAGGGVEQQPPSACRSVGGGRGVGEQEGRHDGRRKLQGRCADQGRQAGARSRRGSGEEKQAKADRGEDEPVVVVAANHQLQIGGVGAKGDRRPRRRKAAAVCGGREEQHSRQRRRRQDRLEGPVGGNRGKEGKGRALGAGRGGPWGGVGGGQPINGRTGSPAIALGVWT